MVVLKAFFQHSYSFLVFDSTYFFYDGEQAIW